MNRNILKMALLTGFMIVCVRGYSQVENSEVPKKVAEALTKKFPKAEDVDWVYGETGLYTANFFEGDDIKEVTFDPTGQWMETLNFLSEDDLPKVVDQTVEESFPGLEYYESIVKVEQKEMTYYLITVETDDAYQKLKIDVNGKLLKTETVLE